MNGGKEEEEEGSDPMARGQYPTGQLCQVSHLELRGEMQMVQGPAGAGSGWGSERLGLAPTALGHSPSQSLSMAGAEGSWLRWGGATPLAL